MSGVEGSDLEQERRRSPGRQDTDLVADIAARVLGELAAEPPVSHELVASMRGIARVEQADIPWPGCLVREDGEFVIKLRAADGRGRKRFTAFHEIAHTFMPGFSVRPQYRCAPAADPAADPASGRRPHIEALCDAGAAELLLPRAPFRKELAGITPTVGLAATLAQRYDSSLEAAARRIVSLRHGRTLLLILEEAPKPSDPRGKPALRVQWAHASQGWPYIPRYKSVPADCLLARALYGEFVNQTGTLTGLADAPLTDVHVSAAAAQYLGGDGQPRTRVLALISPSSPGWHGDAA